MADFKEQTNPLMVRVIPVYLAAELLCPNLFEGAGEEEDQCRQGEGRAGCICHVKRCEEEGKEEEDEESAAGFYLIAAQVNSSNAGAVYELLPNKLCLCRKPN